MYMFGTVLVQLKVWQKIIRILDKKLVKDSPIDKNIDQKKDESDNKDLKR